MKILRLYEAGSDKYYPRIYMKLKKRTLQFIVLVHIFLLVQFVAEVLFGASGVIPIVFVALCVLWILMFKKTSSLLYLFIAMLPNFSIYSGELFGISVLNIITLYCLFYIAIKVKDLGKITTVPCVFLVIWYIYEVADIYIHSGSGIASAITSTISYFVVCICTQALLTGQHQSINDTQLKTNTRLNNADRVIVSFLSGIVFMLLIAYLELIIGKTFFYHLWSGGERYRYGIMRVGSTVADPNNVCFNLIPFLFLVSTECTKRLLYKQYIRLIQILTVAMIFLSGSRTGAVAFIAGLMFYFLGKKRAILLSLIPIFIALESVLNSMVSNLRAIDEDSSNFREYINRNALLLFKNNMIFGVGPGNIVNKINLTIAGASSRNVNTMNTYLYYLVGFGIVGFAFFIAYYILTVLPDLKAWIILKKVKSDQLLRISACISILLLIYTLDTANFAIVWLLPAVLEAGRDNERLASSLEQGRYVSFNKVAE